MQLPLLEIVLPLPCLPSKIDAQAAPNKAMKAEAMEQQRDALLERLKEVRRKSKMVHQYIIPCTQMMTRIKMHYDLRLHALEKLKELVLEKEPDTKFEDALATEIINGSQYDQRIRASEPYRFTPDEHDERMALVLWDLHRLPRKHALARMGINAS